MKVYLVYGYSDGYDRDDVLCVTRTKEIAEEIIKDFKSIDQESTFPGHDGYFIEEEELVT